MKVAVIIPTCNASKLLPEFISALKRQVPKPDHILFIDSSSSDNTIELIHEAGYSIKTISRRDFNHGGTRDLATKLVDADIYVFLTQDALLESSDSISKLIHPLLSSENVGLVYGRQLPHRDAGLLGSHAREFNYPAKSVTKSLADIPHSGIKTCFSSDSFSAYRHIALQQVDGFPTCVIGTEDAYVAGQMLLNNWMVVYASSACVYHSHDYTLLEQFRRYFDIGVFYGRESWISSAFGGTNGEGLRFVKSEIRYLLSYQAFYLIPYAIFQNTVKFIGYRLGKVENRLPLRLKKIISMNHNFWSQDEKE